MSSPQYGAVIASQRPTLYWPLDEAGGTRAFDRSPAPIYHGTYGGSPAFAASGPPLYDGAQAVTFTGSQAITSSYIPFVNGTTRTFCGWANRSTNANGDGLFGNGAGRNIELDISAGSNDLVFAANALDPYVTFAGAWPGTSQWVHWALGFDTTGGATDRQASLYINGTLAGTQTTARQWTTGETFAAGAAFSSGPTLGFHGSLAHLAVFERALTISEIRAQVKASFLLGTPLA